MRNRFLVLVGLILALMVSLGIAPKAVRAQSVSPPPPGAQSIAAADLGQTQFKTTFDDGGPTATMPLGTTAGGKVVAWTNNSTLPNWYAAWDQAATLMIDGIHNDASPGSSDANAQTTPQLYAYAGASRTNDYGFGSVSSDGTTNANIYIGWLFQNNTGGTITSMAVSAVLEQWRGAGVTDKLAFGYTTGSSLTGSLSDFRSVKGVAALDMTSPDTTDKGPIDGNSHQVYLQNGAIGISGLTVAPSDYILLSWLHAPLSGPSNGLAIDDAEVTFSGVIPVNTTTTLNAPSIASGMSSYGKNVDFTATVTKTSDSTAVGSGTVTFTVDGTAVSPASSVGSNGTATLTTALSAGKHSIAAAYNANINFNASSATTITNYAVNMATPTLSVSSSPASPSTVIYGASVAYSATATNPNSNASVPGSMSYAIDTTNCTALSIGKSCNTTLTPVSAPSPGTATTTVTGTFTPTDTTNYNTTSSSATLRVTTATSNTALTTSTVAKPGDTPTFTATVTNLSNPGGGTVPSGSVAFYYNANGKATQIGNSVMLDASGVATANPTADTATLPLGDDSITAVFTPTLNDARFASSTSSAATQSVRADTTVTVVSPTSSTYNGDVVFMANVTPVTDTSTISEGTVTFTVSPGNLQQKGDVTGGSASSAAFTGLDAGSYTVSATYAPSTAPQHYNASDTGRTVFNHVRDKAATKTVLGSDGSTSQFGNPVVFTATLSATTAPTPPNCTACVTFYDGKTALSPASDLKGGVAQFTAPILTLGDHAIKATYAASTDYLTSSDTMTQSVGMADSTIKPAVTTPAPSLVYGAIANFNVAVTANAGSGTPTGTVTLTSDVLTSAPLTLVNGSVAFDSSVLNGFISAGARTLTAAYSGDAFHKPNSASVSFTVLKASTTTAVGGSPGSTVAGQAVAFNAAITGQFAGSPTGMLTFLDGGTSLGSVAVGNASASLSLSNLSVGPHSVTVQYSGDSNFQPSTSQATLATVTLGATTTSVLPSENPVLPGTPINYGVSVSANSPATGTPSGSVVLSVDGTPVGNVTLAGGTGYFQGAALSPGAHQITAQYSGDGQFDVSSSDPATLSVTATATSFTVTSSPDSPYFGQSVTITARLTSQAGTPNGTVTLRDNGAPIATASLAGGVGTFTASTLTVGTHALTVSYNGDGTRIAGNGSIAVVVRRRPTSTTLSQTTAQSAPGDAVTFTANVASDAGPVSDGVVIFTDGGVALGDPVGISGGSASFMTSSLTAGTHDIIAIYQATGGFDTSQSFTLQHTVVDNPKADAGATTTPTPDAGAGAHPGTGTDGDAGIDSGIPDVDSNGTNLGNIKVGNSDTSNSSCSSTGEPLSFGGALLVGIVALFVGRRRRR